jgi:hypothetical protein
MSATVGGVVILRDGKIRPEAIAQLSTEHLRYFLALHALAPYPEALEGTVELQAAVRAELETRVTKGGA